MSFLLNFAKSFSVPTPKPAVPVNLDLSDNTPECNDRTVSLVQSTQIQQDLTISSDDSSTLPPHEGVDLNTSLNHNHNKGDPEVSCKLDQVDVSGKDPQMINTDTPEESTDGNPATGNRGTSHVKTRLRPAGLNRPRHDVYISGLHDETSNDEIRGFMYDIGVSDIVSIERVHDTSSASAAFRVTINDYSIKHNVYNPKVYTNGIKVKPYRLYKQGTQIQDISKPILHNHQNHMTGSTVNNTGKDNQRPNPSQFQKNRSRQSLRKGNNNRMWPIKPHTENQIESPLLSSASSDDNNKSHDSITCVPSNTRPVQLNACAVPYIPRTYNPYTALQHTQVCPSSIPSGTYPYIPEMQPQVSQVQPQVPLMQPQQAQLMQLQNVPQLQQVPQMQRQAPQMQQQVPQMQSQQLPQMQPLQVPQVQLLVPQLQPQLPQMQSQYTGTTLYPSVVHHNQN